MANALVKQDMEEPQHRGRIQAQGGDTNKSVAWAQTTPPTLSEMLSFDALLNKQLTPREQKERDEPLKKLRDFLHRAAAAGGIYAPVSRHFYARGGGDIRIDLEVQKGAICVPTDGNAD